jgi:perosamine synthetase
MTLIPQFAPQFDAADSRSVAKVIESGWISQGPLTTQLEKRIGTIMGYKYAVMTVNGTVAIELALKALGIGLNDTVTTSDLTFAGTANAILNTGASVKFLDINLDGFCVDSADVPVALNGRTVSGGLVIDAAQCLGSRIGKAKIATLSFAPNKIITTGQGGALLTDDPELRDKIARLKDHGRLNKADHHPSVGTDAKFSDLQAALGLSQLDKFRARVKHKRAICKQYQDELANVNGVELLEPSQGGLLLWQDILVQDRDKVQARLLKDFEIETRPFYKPLHTQPSFKTNGHFPNTVKISSMGLWLPSSSNLTSSDISFVTSALKQVVRG